MEGFEATLTFAYSALADSNCEELVAEPEGAPTALPCSMTYDLTGSRTSAE